MLGMVVGGCIFLWWVLGPNLHPARDCFSWQMGVNLSKLNNVKLDPFSHFLPPSIFRGDTT